MKILLTAVNAKYIHSNPAVYSLQKFTAEYAPEYKNDIELAEFTINHYADDILQEIYRRKPDVVAFSCYIWNLQMIEKVLEDLPKVLPADCNLPESETPEPSGLLQYHNFLSLHRFLL